MTILNLTNDGLHNLYDLAFNFIAKHLKVSEKKLFTYCAPENICDDSQLHNVMRTWSKLNVFTKNEDGLWELVDKNNRCPRKSAIKSILAEKHNKDIWGNDFGVDFVRAATWILSQNVTLFEFKLANLQKLESEQFSMLRDKNNIYLLQNGTRVTGFNTWATYLGLLNKAGKIQVDPTNLIRMFLPEIFVNERIEIEVFYQKLSNLIPILDGGIYKELVTSQLIENSWPKPRTDRNEFSTALSRALLILEAENLLSFEDKTGDGTKYHLIYPHGHIARRISHIQMEKH